MKRDIVCSRQCHCSHRWKMLDDKREGGEVSSGCHEVVHNIGGDKEMLDVAGRACDMKNGIAVRGPQLQ